MKDPNFESKNVKNKTKTKKCQNREVFSNFNAQ